MARLSYSAHLALVAFIVSPLFLNAFVRAEETLPEITVYATRTPTAASQLGSTVDVITRQQIETTGLTKASDLLKQVTGVDVAINGSRGSLASVRMRGTEANHVLVLIDGIEVNDYATSGVFFDFSNLSANSIERIEVLKGPQSGLYGSDAFGGVINIITRRTTYGQRLSINAEAGSLGTENLSVHAGFANDIAGVDLIGVYEQTGGDNIARTGSEDDGARYLSGTLKGFIHLGEFHTLRMVARAKDKDTQSDGQDFITGLVTDNFDTGQSSEVALAATLESRFFDERFLSSLYAEISQTSLSFSSAFGTFPYEGEHIKLSWKGDVILPAISSDWSHDFSLFADWEDNSTLGFAGPTATQDQSSKGLGFEYRLSGYERLFITAGARQDFNDQFENATTWRLTGAFLIPESGTRLHASAATGIKNPSPFELYGFFANFVGNPNLRPEEILGFDAGLEQNLWDGRIVLDITGYHNRIDDLITGSGNTAINVSGTSKITGVESSLRVTPLPFVSFTGFYTWQLAENAQNVALIRRPKHKGGVTAELSLLEKRLKIFARAVYTGPATDQNFPLGLVRLDDYWRADAKISYALSDTTEIYVRGENIFDAEIEDVFSYRNPGTEIYAGMTIKLLK
jgi:vitamin B12 transporter